jgi:hypothetical protein
VQVKATSHMTIYICNARKKILILVVESKLTIQNKKIDVKYQVMENSFIHFVRPSSGCMVLWWLMRVIKICSNFSHHWRGM